MGKLLSLLERRAVDKARRVAVSKLVQSGMPHQQAENEVKAVLDDEVKESMDKQRVKIAGKVGAGGILKWLQDHRDQIMQIVQIILSLIGMFGDNSSPQPASNEKGKDDGRDQPRGTSRTGNQGRVRE